MVSFSDLGLKKDLVAHLASLDFTKPTQVQEVVIPPAAQGKNIVFTSRTGSGKTLAYTLPYLSKINTKHPVQMIVMVPTRELAIQVGKELKRVCEPLAINVGVLFGGRDISGDYKTLNKKNHIIVATPGRLLQHINEKHIKVGDVKYVVFDESDQMFDNGFYDECVYLKDRVSKNSQLILSSATFTRKVQSFMASEMGEYVLLKVGDDIPKNIVQEKLFVEIKQKNDALVDFFQKKEFVRALVFCNTKSRCTSVSDRLAYRGFNAKILSSELDQQDRNNRLNLFKEGKIKVLVCTDVAARGLHIENVDLVVNYDVPNREEFYVHRIGRTGRKDGVGYALTFICKEDKERYEEIERRYKINATLLN